MAFLEVRDLTYLYGQGTPFQTDAIKNVSFSAERGEIIGVIGHTGSGKSTLMQHLNGLLRPHSGTVVLDGEDIWTNPKDIRKIRFKVGMVFQYPEHQLFAETVYNDIAYGPQNKGIVGDELNNTVLEAAKLVGIDDCLLSRSPFELSGGQMRRVAIAGVLAMKPKVLVLDEPTAGLDPAGRKLIVSRILEYRRRSNATVFLVSHNMEDIAAVADKVLVMKDGNLALFGTVRDVFGNEKELLEAGLKVPQITKIMLILKEKGLEVNTNCFTVDAAVKSILKYVGGSDL